MSTDNTRTLSEDEIVLRITVPEFFTELVDSHTATLVELGNTETLTAWKENRDQKDREFAELTPEAKREIYLKHHGQSFEMQSIGFAASVARYAAENSIPFDSKRIDPLTASLAYQQIHGEQQNVGGLEIPPEDLRHTIAREIDESKQQYRKAIDPERHSFKEMSAKDRSDLLADQVKVGQEALKAQELSNAQFQNRTGKKTEQER